MLAHGSGKALFFPVHATLGKYHFQIYLHCREFFESSLLWKKMGFVWMEGEKNMFSNVSCVVVHMALLDALSGA